jgi:hypothetical protein
MVPHILIIFMYYLKINKIVKAQLKKNAPTLLLEKNFLVESTGNIMI